jgi:hypothetical protein
VRTGDSGTERAIRAATSRLGTPPATNSQCQLRCSSISPPSTSPTPPPIPNAELIVPMAKPTRSGGNSSRTIAKASGKTAAPTPWTKRNATSEGRSQASAAPSEAEPEHGQRGHEHAFLAVGVAEPADDRRQHGGAQQEAGDDPRGPARGGAELAPEERQRGDDQRLHERQRDAGGGQQAR